MHTWPSPGHAHTKLLLTLHLMLLLLLLLLHVGVEAQDGGTWDWFTPDGWPDSGGVSMATEITYPKRLVQQIKSEEEMAHERLDTRVRNGSGDSSVSLSVLVVFTLWGLCLSMEARDTQGSSTRLQESLS